MPYKFKTGDLVKEKEWNSHLMTIHTRWNLPNGDFENGYSSGNWYVVKFCDNNKKAKYHENDLEEV